MISEQTRLSTNILYLESSLESKDFGNIAYCSKQNSFLGSQINLEGKSLSSLLSQEFREPHTLLMRQYLDKIDKPYFGMKKTRYLRVDHSNYYEAADVTSRLRVDVNLGLYCTTALIQQTCKPFLVLQSDGTISGVSAQINAVDSRLADLLVNNNIRKVSSEIYSMICNAVVKQTLTKQSQTVHQQGGFSQDTGLKLQPSKL